jgi:hypothetical protein
MLGAPRAPVEKAPLIMGGPNCVAMRLSTEFITMKPSTYAWVMEDH